MEKIEKLKTYTDEQIEQMGVEELKKKFKEIQSIAEYGQDIIALSNTISEKYKLALFMVIRNDNVLPIGKKLKKSNYEINKMTYLTMQELFKIIDFKKAKEMYEEVEKYE